MEFFYAMTKVTVDNGAKARFWDAPGRTGLPQKPSRRPSTQFPKTKDGLPGKLSPMMRGYCKSTSPMVYPFNISKSSQNFGKLCQIHI
jgi:hypothetical protein